MVWKDVFKNTSTSNWRSSFKILCNDQPNVNTNLALISHPEYYNFNKYEDATWKMDQYNNAVNELREEGHNFENVEPDPIPQEDAQVVHTPEYTQKVFGNPRGQYTAWAGGPWDETSQKSVLRSTGGTVRTNNEAMQRGVAVHLYDAFHHAYPDHGEGLCVLNDVAIAAKKMSQIGKRVMIIDTDVHQGQGTAVCTQGDKNIFTLSMHEKENYPHNKEKSSLDVELWNKVSDKSYLSLLNNALNNANQQFPNPDLVMYIAGTDLYGDDRLSNTKISIGGIQTRDQLVFDFFGKLGIPVAVSIPQGYARNPEDTKSMIKNTIIEAKNAKEKYYGGR